MENSLLEYLLFYVHLILLGIVFSGIIYRKE
jgi:hypothetical protein